MDDLLVEVMTNPAPPATAPVVDLVDSVTAVLGHVALSEHKRDELDRWAHPASADGTSDGAPGAVGLVARATDADGALLGYAHLSGDGGSQFAVELVVPEAAVDVRADPTPVDVADVLLDAVEEVVTERGGGLLRLWAALADETDDARAKAHRFVLERELLQMRCALPLAPLEAPLFAGTSTELRSFRPGLDEEAWLTTNNRAFASHPEQGHWTLDTLVEREREPWFDPDGFVVLESGGRLAGSCWTKVHGTVDPPMGEIYVISVDPDFHGRGWGRALTRAGLDWLAARGLTVGMLYVDAANDAAVSLYRSMGFTVDHVDRAYVKQVASVERAASH